MQSGTLGIREDNRRFEVAAGQSLVLAAGREHGGTRDYPLDLRFYWIHFVPRAGRTVGQSVPVPQYGSVSRPERLVELFRWFLDDQEAGWLRPEQADLLVAQMLLEVADLRPSGAPAERTAALLASRAEEFLRLHFAEPIGTAQVARGLSCHPDYLGRVFRRAYGQTLTESLHRCRLRHARRLLLDREMNIDAVARQSGYDDAGYFRRVFRRVEGMTPGAFRRLYSRVHVNTE